MENKRIMGIILAASILFSGCSANLKNKETVIDGSEDALGSADETVTVTEETTKVPETVSLCRRKL